MPRLPRFDLADVPQLVLQRGRGGNACFMSADDHRCYLAQLLHASLRWRCSVHAYVLMPDRVYLLVTPSRLGALAGMMQSIGRNYVNHINVTYHRSGTLWEGRYKSCLVDADNNLLTCHRFIESAPVRAGLVSEPATYLWCSHRCNALGDIDLLVDPHARYLALGQHEEARLLAYRSLFLEELTERDLDEIRRYVQQQRVLGSSDFQEQVEAKLGRYAKVRPAHRPPRLQNATAPSP